MSHYNKEYLVLLNGFCCVGVPLHINFFTNAGFVLGKTVALSFLYVIKHLLHFCLMIKTD